MLFNANLSKDLWARVVKTAYYLVNRSPITTIDLKTPNEVWSSTHTDYSNQKIFGGFAYFHVNE